MIGKGSFGPITGVEFFAENVVTGQSTIKYLLPE